MTYTKHTGSYLPYIVITQSKTGSKAHNESNKSKPCRHICKDNKYFSLQLNCKYGFGANLIKLWLSTDAMLNLNRLSFVGTPLSHPQY